MSLKVLDDNLDVEMVESEDEEDQLREEVPEAALAQCLPTATATADEGSAPAAEADSRSDSASDIEDTMEIDEQGAAVAPNALPDDGQNDGSEASQDIDFRCIFDGCGMTFPDSSALFTHLAAHIGTGEEKKTVSCDVCHKKLSKMGNLKRHMETHSAKNAKPKFKCDECGKVFGQLANLKRHKIIHLPESDPQRQKFGCELCGKLLYSAQALNNHMLLIHSDNPDERPYACDVCDKRFKNITTLKSHKTTHLSEEELKFGCKFCGKKFGRSEQLKAHMIRHTGKYNWNCANCDKGFNRTSEYKKHLERYLTRVTERFQRVGNEQQEIANATASLELLNDEEYLKMAKSLRQTMNKEGMNEVKVEEASSNDDEEKPSTSQQAAKRDRRKTK